MCCGNLLTCHGDEPLTPTPRVSNATSQRADTAEAEGSFNGPLPPLSCTSFGAAPRPMSPPLPVLVCVLVRGCLHACSHAWVRVCVGAYACLCVCLWSTSVYPGSPLLCPKRLITTGPPEGMTPLLVLTVSSSCCNTLSPPNTFGMVATFPSWDISVTPQYCGVCLNRTGGSNFFYSGPNPTVPLY